MGSPSAKASADWAAGEAIWGRGGTRPYQIPSMGGDAKKTAAETQGAARRPMDVVDVVDVVDVDGHG